MKEIWKDIKGYEGLYQASNFGNVKSLKRTCYNGRGIRVVKERIMKPWKRNDKYLQVSLSNGKLKQNLLVHCLVGSAFLGYTIKRNGFVIDHIDSDKSNNNLENLRIVTCRSNVSKEVHSRSKSKLVGAIWNKSNNKWISRISINGKPIHLGTFDTDIEASNAYNEKLKTIKNK